MAPKTIAIRTSGVDPVSPIRDDQVARAAATTASSNRNQKNNGNNTSRSNRGSGRSLNTRSTGHFAVRSNSGGILMDPADHAAWSRLGGELPSEPAANVPSPAPVTNVARATQSVGRSSSATAATAEETTVATRSTSSGSVSSGTRQLRQSVKQHERELSALKSKYEEAKTKMSEMKQEKSSNKKMLLEMSGLIKALQDISVDYEQSKDSNNSNDGSKSSSSSKSHHKAHLQNIQRKIQAIDTQMRATKTQCGLLEEEKSLHTSTIKAQESQISALQDQINLLCRRLEQSTKSNSNDQAELQKIIQLQETQIGSLEAQIGMLKRNADDRRITSVDQQNKARYQEISSLEDKLAALREAQNAHKIQASALRSLSSASQDSQEEPMEEMSDDIFDEDEEDAPVQSKESAKRANKSKKSGSFGKSARKKNKNVSFGNLSVTSGSLAAISEENSECSGSRSLPEASGTSASETTGDTTTTSSDEDSSSDSSSANDDEEESTTCADSNTASVSQKERNVMLETSEDGSSVEIMEAATSKEADTILYEGESSKVKAANNTKSSHSSRVNIMDEIKEEVDEVASAVLESVGEEEQQTLLNELQETKDKYSALKQDYQKNLSDSATRLKQLEQENQELRDSRQGLVLRTAQAIDTATSVDDITKLKQENEQLRKDIAKKEAMLSFSNTKFENLRTEHTQTILELKGKSCQQEDLFSTDSNITDDGVVDIETYTRLEKVHEAVVMKLADLGEDNDRLERERDAAKEQLQSMYSQMQSHDETMFELQKVRASYRLLEEERDAMQSKLDRIKDRNSVLQGNSDDTSQVRQELADSLARIEVLEKTNEEFGDIETKFTASEVRVSMLEGELEKADRKLKESTSKQSERESQIREVIGQYKILKGKYVQSEARVKRLESVVESDKQIASKITMKAGVSESARTERTSSSGEFSATRFAAMTAQLAAYDGQINKLQKQRDAALEQMKEMEGDLEMAKKESADAFESKKCREKDLRIVLQHYEKLQKKYEETSKEFGEMTRKYEETVKKIDYLEEQINGKSSFPTPLQENESNKDEAVGEMQLKTDEIEQTNEGTEKTKPSKEADDDSSIDQLLDDMEKLKQSNGTTANTAIALRKEEADDIDSIADALPTSSNDPSPNTEHSNLINQLKEAKESSTWKNEKIAKVLTELKASQDKIETLEEEKAQLQSDLSILKGHLLIARKEAATAKERIQNREVNLRNAIAKHHRLQQSYVTLETKFEELQQKLETAHKDAKIREEEAKEARQRASGVHTQFKRLQVDHSEVLDRLERLKQELEMYKATTEV